MPQKYSEMCRALVDRMVAYRLGNYYAPSRSVVIMATVGEVEQAGGGPATVVETSGDRYRQFAGGLQLCSGQDPAAQAGEFAHYDGPRRFRSLRQLNSDAESLHSTTR